ncbi:nucleotidyltransferase domain-containing protein [Methanosarcina sp. KYL-1]|uniref:type VII toxin-antitoxin system MntA family adenylyltransferase antitoxin n=1 Tax=Methanosarcina sp. KYL-1 TaxID=2602068 RepID=UPI0021015454|nr:nucleotidyltransferase domain-containing protein [Methanosarcina sp. KYL-1]MCQ1535848.1 nucleotidyltransferase domain-containing protein [Methanosarcina sp. KYL-1]
MLSATPQYDLKELENKLSEFFSGVDSVTVAYLFGSTVRGEANGLSDIDIAVLFDDSVSKKEAFDLQLELIGELGILLKTNNIDLVVLNESPLLLTYNIIRDGIILKSDERKRVLFETRVMSKYLDHDYYVKRHMKMTLERMAKGRFRWDRK